MRRFMALGVAMAMLSLAGCTSGANSEIEEGLELMVADEYPAAIEHFNGMLEQYPDNPYAHLNIGVSYQRMGQTDLARQHYQAAIEHGGDARVTRTVEEGGMGERRTTVAELARQNLETLGN